MKAYEQLMDHVRELALVGSIGSILGWDQETMMPDGAVAIRGRQMSYLAGLSHEKITDPRVGEWLAACEADATLTADPVSPAAVNLREIGRSYDRQVRLPASLVAELAEVGTASRHAWIDARKKSEYGLFKPYLTKILSLLRQKAECLKLPEHQEPWDALADGYEPDLRATEVEAVFGPLRRELTSLLSEVQNSGRQPEDRFNAVKVPADEQMRFVRMVAEKLGFDFSRGRLDTSTHPFCGGVDRVDVRLTTRFHEAMLGDCLGSTMHETGHGLYEQGLPEAFFFEPVGNHAGLSVHESQSRLWENMVGRSDAFWRWAGPELRRIIPGRFDDLSHDDIVSSMNRAEPSLIRVEADELTYNLHIMIRFDLERTMLKGELSTDDLPEAWNRRYRDDLGLTVPDDRRGCMQDVHWAMGAMGYFPTYTLGNILAAQFYDAAQQAIPNLEEAIGCGEFAPLLSWLRREIHDQGATYRAGELCERVTGRKPEIAPLMRHLRSRMAPVYGLA